VEVEQGVGHVLGIGLVENIKYISSMHMQQEVAKRRLCTDGEGWRKQSENYSVFDEVFMSWFDCCIFVPRLAMLD